MAPPAAASSATVIIASATPLSPIDLDENGKPALAIDAATLYAFGHLIRSTEQLLLELFSKGLLSGTTHTCIGQELCQMSVVRALNDSDDVVLSNHRNHGHFLTYSGKFYGLVAEIMGRESGICCGVGGSQHLAYRNFHSNGVQGGLTAIGVGLARARRMRGSAGIVACFIGDGTLGEGLVYESLNLASVWHAPILFVVEDNGIAQTTPTADTTGGSIPARGSAFGLRTWELDDASATLFEDAEDVVRTVRATREPGFLVIRTRRLGPHSKGDDLRDAEEMDAIRRRDPLARLGASLATDARARIEASNFEFIARIRESATAAPPAKPRAVKSPRRASAPLGQGTLSVVQPPKNVRASLNAALRKLLRERQDVVLLGEDLHDPYGGAFKVTSGLSTEFPGRVISTPISEAGVVGAGIGLALAGFRPIVEIMFADFIALAMDQLYNQAVKFPAMFNHVEIPLVIRTPCGGRRGYGPTHSQSPENLMSAVPGLTVVFGSHRHDVGDLLNAAVSMWQRPTVFFEHKLVYGEMQDPDGYTVLPAAPADTAADLFPTLVRRRTQPDVTLVAYGGMLPIVEHAAGKLEAEDFVVEIVVPSLLQPMPVQTLLGALLDRKRVAIVEESHEGPGFGSELGASLLEQGFRGRLIRVATPRVPIPAARSLEAAVLVGEQELFDRLAAFLSLDPV